MNIIVKRTLYMSHIHTLAHLLRYLVDCDEDELSLDPDFNKAIQLMESDQDYHICAGDDALVCTYQNLLNFKRKKTFLVSFLERWLAIDCIETAIWGKRIFHGLETRTHHFIILHSSLNN